MDVSEDYINSFYYEFEKKYRGSEELIKKRLEFYLPLFKVYKENSTEKPRFLDLGCGRGEFLEHAREYGFEVEGVEVNKINVDICKNKGLNVYHTDGLEFIKNTPDEQYHIISLIHVIEHLEFEYLLKLLSEIYRALKPGGILILETPYTKNPMVGLYNFWLDPTHKRPIHEELIRFLGIKIGFSHIEVMGLNSNHTSLDIKLSSVFSLSAPDLSIILLKNTTERELYTKLISTLEELKQQASKGLEELLQHHDEQIAAIIENHEQSENETKNRLQNHDEQIVALVESHQKLENETKNRLQNHDEQIVALVERVNVLDATLGMIYDSKLWRFYRVTSKAKNSIKDVPRKLVLFLYRKIEKNSMKIP